MKIITWSVFACTINDHAENHPHSEDVTRFVYSITPPIWRRSDSYLAFGHMRQQLEESLQQVTPDEDTAYKVSPNAVKSKTPRRSSKPQASLACFWC